MSDTVTTGGDATAVAAAAAHAPGPSSTRSCSSLAGIGLLAVTYALATKLLVPTARRRVTR